MRSTPLGVHDQTLAPVTMAKEYNNKYGITKVMDNIEKTEWETV